MGGINVSCHMCLFSVEVTCRGPAPAGSRGYPGDERRWREKEREKTRETSLDRAKSARERERVTRAGVRQSLAESGNA